MTRKATNKSKPRGSKTSCDHKTKTPTIPAIDFYIKTKDFLKKLADAKGVKDLEKYYHLTDTRATWYEEVEGEMNKCFAQLVFHGQNAPIISKIVKFEENVGFLKEVCFGFDPVKFFTTYGNAEKDQVEALVGKLRYDDKDNLEGLKWMRTKSKPKNKDKIAKRFATLLIRGSQYLKDFGSQQELVEDLLTLGKTTAKGETNSESIINYFMEKMEDNSGFSVALTCDFLKELDSSFNFLAKPDRHIKDVLGTYLKNDKKYYYQTRNGDFECLSDFQTIVSDINDNLCGKEKITVYQLDRMIWLICSGNFFLESEGLGKNDFLREISRD